MKQDTTSITRAINIIICGSETHAAKVEQLKKIPNSPNARKKRTWLPNIDKCVQLLGVSCARQRAEICDKVRTRSILWAANSRAHCIQNPIKAVLVENDIPPTELRHIMCSLGFDMTSAVRLGDWE